MTQSPSWGKREGKSNLGEPHATEGKVPPGGKNDSTVRED